MPIHVSISYHTKPRLDISFGTQNSATRAITQIKAALKNNLNFAELTVDGKSKLVSLIDFRELDLVALSDGVSPK